MINMVGNALNTIAPTQWQLRPSEFPSLTFSFITENGEVYADDEEIETGYVLQVDVWSKADYTDIVNQVKNTMKQIGFYRSFENDEYEADIKIYHKIIRFNYTKQIN